MRPDLAKTAITGGGGRGGFGEFPRGKKKFKRIDPEDGNIKSLGMRKAHVVAGNGYGRRYPNTRHSVLRRLLQGYRGQPWNDVYSEICSTADDRSFQGHELREALEWMVVKNCTLGEDGTVLDAKGQPLNGSSIRGFYVHPKTGLLEEIKRISRRHYRWWNPDNQQTIFELDGCYYHKHGDIWYRVVMADVPWVKGSWTYYHYEYERAWTEDAFNTEPGKPWDYYNTIRYKYGCNPQGRPWYCKEKQSANKKEIAKLKKKYGVT